MVKIIYDLTIKIVITWGNIVGTFLCVAGVVHAFIVSDAGTTGVIVGAGATLLGVRPFIDKIGTPCSPVEVKQ
jgi:hypothetical protein